MAHPDASKRPGDAATTKAALAAMDADALRSLIREMIPWLDESMQIRFESAIIDRAARSSTAWTPAGPTEQSVDEVLAFAEAAKKVGRADPSVVDDHLQKGTNAFLAKDYSAALEIFRALLLPISEVEIDLGQHEMVDEVLGVDIQACAAQYVVLMYMSADVTQRPAAVRTAIGEMGGVGYFWEPLRQMERVAVEPLPDLDAFLPRWRALIEDDAEPKRHSDWDADQDRWLREVVQRLEGTEGLAKVARSTKRADDLCAWCRMLVESKNWEAALAAHEEAAEIVTDKMYSRGDFLDGAALAAQELGRKDLPARLERAWREAPSMLRLRRWLGSSGSKRAVRKRAAEALDACPKNAGRQRAFLHVLIGDYAAAAKLLSAAPGLGWSGGEHPGHLVFPLFRAVLSDEPLAAPLGSRDARGSGMDVDELEWTSADGDEPRLALPAEHDILALADAGGSRDTAAREAMLRAMRKAAEKRLDGVTDKRRRRHYGHAAELVAACAASDASAATRRWVEEIRDEYRRYPALQRELNAHLGLPAR